MCLTCRTCSLRRDSEMINKTNPFKVRINVIIIQDADDILYSQAPSYGSVLRH